MVLRKKPAASCSASRTVKATIPAKRPASRKKEGISAVAPHLLPAYCPPRDPHDDGIMYRPPCPGIGNMDPKHFVFYILKDERSGKLCALRGYRSCKGYLYRNVGLNLFELGDMKIPLRATPTSPPPKKWVAEHFWSKTTNRLMPDLSKMPKNASGKAYRIEDNGSMPYVAYVRDDSVSVFRRPRKSYKMDSDEDFHFIFDVDRLFFTEEVATFRNVRKVWIGIDKDYKRNGWLGVKNSSCDGCNILVQVSSTRYVFIGSEIFSFSSPEQVTAFHCQMRGDCAVPYPVVLTSSTVMFTRLQLQVKREKIKPLLTQGRAKGDRQRCVSGDWADAYDPFFQHFYNRDVDNTYRMKDVKMIRRRMM